MWLKDSTGAFVDVLTSLGARGLDEGADYAQYGWRRAYDWRRPATVAYFIDEVLSFVLESETLTGAFFDDVDFISALCVPGWYGSCTVNGSRTPESCCENRTEADAAELLDSTAAAVVEVIEAFAAKGKTPVCRYSRMAGCRRKAGCSTPRFCRPCSSTRTPMS